MTVFFILLLVLFAFIAVPLLATLIYKYFYDNDLNKSLQSELPVKKWFSPLSLFFILLILEFFLLLGIMFISNHRSTSSTDESMEDGYSYIVETQEQMDRSLLHGMNGADVSGYKLEDQSRENITCQVYKNENDDLLPAYVVRICYTGEKNIGCWDVTAEVSDASLSSMGDFEEEQVIYIIFDSSCRGEEINLVCEMYEGSLDAYDTGDLGTYEMPEPDENISFCVK